MKGRLCFALLLLALLCAIWPVSALADADVDRVISGLELDEWQEAADEAHSQIDVRSLLAELAKGDAGLNPDGWIESAKEVVLKEIALLFPSLLAIMAPALFWAIHRYFMLGESGALTSVSSTVCFLAEAVVLMNVLGGQIISAREAMQRIGALTERVFPVLNALLLASGGAGTASVMQPAASFLGTTLSALMYRTTLILTSCAAVLAICGNLTDRLRLKGLYALAKSTNNWLMGIAMTAFLALMTINGLLGSARDGISIRTAKYAVDNLLPVIGGEVADTMDAVVAGVLLVKNAAGVTSALILAAICLQPILRLVLSIVMCRLAAALTEPIADGPLVDCISQFAGVLQMLLVALSACAVLFVILVGALVASGNAIAMLR